MNKILIVITYVSYLEVNYLRKKIGVLAMQGAFAEHIKTLEKLGTDYIEIRQKSDLIFNHIDGLILPGGESTVIGRLIIDLNIHDYLKRLIENGLPVLGTCAGLILLAKNISNDRNTYLRTMDIVAVRNAYGRQLGSFTAHGCFAGIGDIPMIFIRAPFIEQISKNVEILAIIDNHIVAARQDNMIVTAFHPELTSDLRVHEFFLNNIK